MQRHSAASGSGRRASKPSFQGVMCCTCEDASYLPMVMQLSFVLQALLQHMIGTYCSSQTVATLKRTNPMSAACTWCALIRFAFQAVSEPSDGKKERPLEAWTAGKQQAKATGKVSLGNAMMSIVDSKIAPLFPPSHTHEEGLRHCRL